MAELGSHQLDAASIFIAAAHDGEKQHAACASRPRPTGRCSRPTATSRTTCIASSSFPRPATTPKDPLSQPQEDRRAVRLDQRQRLRRLRRDRLRHRRDARSWSGSRSCRSSGDANGAEQRARSPAAAGRRWTPRPAARRRPWPRPPAAGRRSAAATPRRWSIGPGASAIRPRRTSPVAVPKVAMGDAIIALTANMAARQGSADRVQEEWFDIHSDETPEGVAAERRTV